MPRTEMVWIEADKTLRQAHCPCLRSGFSRIPVIAENLDDVVGVVYLKDVARRIFEDRGSGATSMSTPSCVGITSSLTASAPTTCCATTCRPRDVQLSIVVDANTAGDRGRRVTGIEDILEEIVSEILRRVRQQVPKWRIRLPTATGSARGWVSMTSPSSMPVRSPRSSARARTWIPSAGCSDVGWGGSDPGTHVDIDGYGSPPMGGGTAQPGRYRPGRETAEQSEVDNESGGRELLTLARAARGGSALRSAAVRDEMGRNYTGATVDLASLRLGALDVAIAQAVASGARGLEAVVVVGGMALTLSAVTDLGGPGVPVWVV